DPRQLQHALRTWLCRAAVSLGDAVSLPLDSHERPGARHGRAVVAGVLRARANQRPGGSSGEDSRVSGDGTVLRGGRQERAVNRTIGSQLIRTLAQPSW